MKPEHKALTIDDILTIVSGKDRRKVIARGTCATCETPNMEFKTDLDRKEYRLSGMCQNCQDSAFTEPEDDDSYISLENAFMRLFMPNFHRKLK